MEEVMCFHEPKSMAPALSFSAFLRPVPKDDPAQPTADVKQEKIQPSDCADKQTGMVCYICGFNQCFFGNTSESNYRKPENYI